MARYATAFQALRVVAEERAFTEKAVEGLVHLNQSRMDRESALGLFDESSDSCRVAEGTHGAQALVIVVRHDAAPHDRLDEQTLLRAEPIKM